MGDPPRRQRIAGAAQPDRPRGEVTAGWRVVGDRVVYALQTKEAIGYAGRVYTSPIDGSSDPAEVSVENDEWNVIHDLDVVAGRILYRQSYEYSDDAALWSAPLDGSSQAIRLDGTATGIRVSAYTTAFYFAGLAGPQYRAAFVANLDHSTRRDLYVVSIFGGTPTRVTGSFQAGADVEDVLLSGLLGSVYFVADGHTDRAMDVYATSVSSPSPERLTAHGANARVLAPLKLAVGSPSRLLYRAATTLAADLHLYSVPTDGSATPRRLSPTLAAGGRVQEFFATAGGTRAVFRADRFAQGVFGLYSGRYIDGAYSAVSATVPVVSGCPGVCDDWQLTDDDHVVWREATTEDGATGLYSATIVGTASQTFTIADTSFFDVTGSGVLIWITEPSSKGMVTSRAELYRAAVGGPLPHFPLTGFSFSAQNGVSQAVLLPDESRIAVLWDHENPPYDGLYIADDDGEHLSFVGSSATVGENAGTVAVEVVLSQAAIDETVVSVAVVGGTAGAADWSRIPASEAVIPPGHTTATLALGIVDDLATEGTETLVLEIASETPHEGGDFTVIILDDETGLIFSDGFESGDTSAW